MDDEKTVLLSETSDNEQTTYVEENTENIINHSPVWNSPKFIIIAALCLIAVIVTITIVISSADGEDNDIAHKLETARKYLTEMKYEEAKAIYEEIIEADPKCEEAYIGLSEAYIGLGDKDKALEVLKQGINKVENSSALEEKLDVIEKEYKNDFKENSTTIKPYGDETTTEPETTTKEDDITEMPTTEIISEENTTIYAPATTESATSSQPQTEELTTQNPPDMPLQSGEGWSVDDGVLTISSDAAMKSVENGGAAPWSDIKAQITEVSIKNGVSYIPELAFDSCENIVNVTIPDSVTYIGDSSFYFCGSLKSITIPDSVTYIGSAAFNGSGLLSVTIPDSVQIIGAFAFAICDNLQSVTLSKNIKEIDAYTFNSCESLKSIYIPETVQNIDTTAFEGCNGFIVEGSKDSYAEAFAEHYGYEFIVRGE